jgi:predicted component of type VI protein secretion system
MTKETCPDCDEPMEEHLHHRLEIDLNEVIAVWMMAYGESRVEVPKGVTREDLARCLGMTVRKLDPDYYNALLRAAGEVTQFLIEKMMEAQDIPPIGGVMGRA